MANIDYSKYGYQPEQQKTAGNNAVDYSKYGYDPQNQQVASNNPQYSVVNDFPSFIKAALDIGSTFTSKKPLKQAIPERIGGVVRGGKDIGQGLAQFGLTAGEKFGLVPSKTVDDYTRAKDAERKLYEQSAGGKDPYTRFLREQTQGLPYMAIPAALKPEASLIKNLLRGGAAGGAVGMTKYAPEGTDRAVNTLQGIGTGATMAALLHAPELVEKGVGLFSTGDKALMSKFPFKEQAIAEKKLSLQEAIDAHQKQLEAEQAAKTASEQETGKAKPSTMQFAVSGKEKDIAEKQQEVGALNKQLEEQKNLPELPEIDTASHEQNVANAENAVQESNQHIQNVKQSHDQAKQNLRQSEAEVGQHLNTGAAHDVRAAAKIDQGIEANKQEINGIYDKLDDNLSSIDINIPKSRTSQEILQDISELARKNEGQSPQATQLLEELDNIGKADTVNARDYLRVFRTARDYARDARKNSYKPGMKEEDRYKWEQEADALDDKVDKIRKTLRDGIGEDNQKLLDEATNRWRDEVASLYKNKLYQKIHYEGRMPDNVIKELRGKVKGNDIIKNIIKNDPGLLKNVVGQRYDASTAARAKVYNPNEQIKEYTDLMPELKNLTEKRNQHLGNVEKSKVNISNAEKRHEEIKQSHKEAINAKKVAETEKGRIQTEKEQREKDQKKIEDQIEGHKQDIVRMNGEKDKLNKHINILLEEAKKSNITAKRMMEIKKEIEADKAELRELNKSIDQSKGKAFKLLKSGYKFGRGLFRAISRL